ncbi:hypothetical protein [Chlorobaculum thiosulfatiphilum]|uniref:hypothetical protein n=1 Tax=Chlorobaculum thiosulfatiphilum TaxID=115852 RepID=UPI001476BAC4|nr:hypothetical protein [Chlorobaculum thiosulfatiphilum]
MNRICFETKGTPKRQANGKLSGNRLHLRTIPACRDTLPHMGFERLDVKSQL